MNNSFPPPQSTSIFSKTTPGSTSFTFGSNPNPTQTSTFGAPTQNAAADNDVSMEISAELQSRSPEKSAAPEQPAENKPAPPTFGSSSTFSFKPMNNEASGDQKTLSGLGTSWMRPKKSPNEQPSSTPASTAESNIPPAQSTPSLGPVSNPFGKPQESGKKNDESTDAPPSTPFNPFSVLNPAEKEGAQENKPVSPFIFGAQASQKEGQEKTSEQKSQDKAPFNPFSSLQTGTLGNAANQSQEQNSAPPFFQPSKPAESDTHQASTPFKFFPPSKSTGAEKSQDAPGFKPFQSMQSSNAEKSAEKSTTASTPANNFFQPFKPSTTEESSAGKSSQKPTSSTFFPIAGESKKSPQEETTGSSPPKPNPVSILKRSTFGKPSVSPSKSTSTQDFPQSGNAIEQLQASDTGAIKKAPSQTSNLFAQTLAKSSPPTTGHQNDALAPQSHDQTRTKSPTKPASPPEKGVDFMHETASSKTTTEPVGVKVKSHGASNIPLELDNNDFVDYDKSYRLRSLNEMLKKRIAGLDPARHDFEPIIRFYAAEREAIGYPMGGLYHRVKAGDKRKTEEADRVDEAPNPSKRARLGPSVECTNQQLAAPVFGFSAITSVHTTPVPATAAPEMPNNNFNTSQNLSTAQPPATSNTSNVFKSMILANQPSFGMQASTSPPKSALNTQTNGGNSSFTSINSSQSSFQSFQKPPGPFSNLETPKASSVHSNFISNFATQAKKDSINAKTKRKSEDYDSREEDEGDWEQRVFQADRAKRAKIGSMVHSGSSPGFKPSTSSTSSTNGASPTPEQDGESTRDASNEGSVQSEDRQGSEPDEGGQGDGGGGDFQRDSLETEESDDDDEDDIQTSMAKSRSKAKNPFDSSSDPTSLFNRITKPDTLTESIEKKTETPSSSSTQSANAIIADPPGSGLFGSRPSTPSQDTPKASGSNLFGNLGSSTPIGDNTWKPGSAIKLGTPTSAPTVNITSATPPAKTNGDTVQTPFSTFSAAAAASSALKLTGENDDTPKAPTIFGQPSSISQSGPGSKPFSALFGDASKKTTVNQSSAAQVGWTFGVPKTGASASPLLAPSNATSSAITSRATSPSGLTTDNDSAAESGPDDQQNQDPQSDFMASRPGEENEDVLFEVRTKALEFMSEKELVALGHSKDDAGWKTRGLGPLRVLRNSETNRARIVMRSEPGANVVINSPLIDENKYDITTSSSEKGGKGQGSLKMGVWKDGKLKNWVFKIKTVEIAEELVEYLKKNEPKLLDGEQKEKEDK